MIGLILLAMAALAGAVGAGGVGVADEAANGARRWPALTVPVEYSKLLTPPEPGARRLNSAEIQAVLTRMGGRINLNRIDRDVGGLGEGYSPDGRWQASAFVIEEKAYFHGIWYIKDDYLCHSVENGNVIVGKSFILGNPYDGSRYERRYTKTFCRTAWQSADKKSLIMSSYLRGFLEDHLLYYGN